jgi:dolichol-phosphate mannosyltransferase
VQPDNSRDFVYVDDAVYATLLCANQIGKVQGRSLNIASNHKTTIRDIVAEIQSLFGIKSEPIWGDMPNRRWDLKEWYGDARLAEELTGWKSETSLREGLALTAEWQRNYAMPLYEKKLVQDKIIHKLTAVIACYKDAQAIPIMHERLTKTFRKIGVD